VLESIVLFTFRYLPSDLGPATTVEDQCRQFGMLPNREGEVATPYLPSTCAGNNQCLYPFPVALCLPQIEITIFAVSALYNETE